MPKRKSPDYEVGYGKPPRHSQFKPGQSGNPKGRPKGAKNIDTIMQEALFQSVQITRGGRKVTVTAFEALLMRMMKGALEGDARSTTNLLKIATILQANQHRSAAASDTDEGAATPERPLEEVDREVLKHFAEMVRDGSLDLSGDEEDSP